MVKPQWIFFDLTKWVSTNDMTSKEKTEFTSWETCGGYLRKYEYKDAAKLAWDNASHEDRMLTYTLPNFDASIAQDIFGIDFEDYLNKFKTKTEPEKCIEIEITVNGHKYRRCD